VLPKELQQVLIDMQHEIHGKGQEFHLSAPR
jgi:hypothetical protein